MPRYAFVAAALTGLAFLSPASAQQFATPPALVFNSASETPHTAPHPSRSGALAACARDFRSFDRRAGTYTTHSGERALCPYLRG